MPYNRSRPDAYSGINKVCEHLGAVLQRHFWPLCPLGETPIKDYSVLLINIQDFKYGYKCQEIASPSRSHVFFKSLIKGRFTANIDVLWFIVVVKSSGHGWFLQVTGDHTGHDFIVTTKIFLDCFRLGRRLPQSPNFSWLYCFSLFLLPRFYSL